MGTIFYILGKSSTGKDTIFNRLMEDVSLKLNKVVMYTTRPMRDGEINGDTYHFVKEEDYLCLKNSGKIIEERAYNTMHGLWRYFTADDNQIEINKASADYLMSGVLSSYISTRDYFGEDRVLPIYIEVEDGERLQRALDREKLPCNHKYVELCRRFLADNEDFSEEKLKEGKITRRFINNNLDSVIREITEYIKGVNRGY